MAEENKTKKTEQFIYSVQNGNVYVLLLKENSGKWVLPSATVSLSSSSKDALAQRVKELVSLDTSVSKHFFVKGAEGNEECFIAETGHTPVYLTQNSGFSEVKWFLQNEILSLGVDEQTLLVIKNGFSQIPTHSNLSYSRLGTVVALICVVLVAGYYISTHQKQDSGVKVRKMSDVYLKNEEASYKKSILQGDSKGLQDLVVQDMKEGINDKFTKSDAYFITHRYFDNGGNIYEIYDFVNSHPELAFMKEAESIAPLSFSAIKKNMLPKFSTDAGMYALLAYMEVLDKRGYADMATQATIANQYAKLAYFSKKRVDDTPSLAKFYSATTTRRDAQKATFYVGKTKGGILKLLSASSTSKVGIEDIGTLYESNRISFSDITERDLLVGVNQYAAAIRYLSAYGIQGVSLNETVPLFRFAQKFSHDRVPELEKFTSLLNASTFVLVSTDSKDDFNAILRPIAKSGKYDDPEGLTKKLITARFEKSTLYPGTKLPVVDLDVYGKYNAVLLAKKSSDFKKWLILNGWQESDFK